MITFTIIAFIAMLICWFGIGFMVAGIIRLRKIRQILGELKLETTTRENVKAKLAQLEILRKMGYFII